MESEFTDILTLDRATFENIESLSSQPIAILTAPTEHTSGTQIRLLGLHRDLRLPAHMFLFSRSFYKALPNRPDFRVYVNDIECSAEDTPGERCI